MVRCKRELATNNNYTKIIFVNERYPKYLMCHTMLGCVLINVFIPYFWPEQFYNKTIESAAR
jgi:hypothetical protein